MSDDTTSRAFFEEKYLADADPWEFASSAYEQQRYDTILQALYPHRYERAFEPGCSIGILTARLATVCGQVVAMDISPTAVSSARERCKHLGNVEISCGVLPVQMPSGSFDLIVLSEIGYYFDSERLLTMATALVQQLRVAGTLLAVHWLGVSADHPLSGDVVHEMIGNVPELSHRYQRRHLDQRRQLGFRLDRWVRR